MFSWIPIHREAIARIVEHQDQKELLAVLRDMEQAGLKTVLLRDKRAGGETIPLEEIDPFTFFVTFNRGITDDNRRQNWSFIKSRWKLSAETPSDFTGLPKLDNRSSWLFNYAKDREPDHIQSLWRVATSGAHG